ncbi:sensor histidine kinase [Cytobacillus sp. FSL W7-1323]|uniref:histidine kinase n=1 Tax=Cytobacillus kochii TaxID=859143 RepID=A0A248TF86_9BACI|nr:MULTISPECIES: sensor histidine kinase [Cytobacillus]ASV66864.1 hypothetical protein CKF48_05725 [Cytobacillus kochii]MDQ0187887.1 CitB family two-component system sensor histidine kinase CitS [Cytobacillus kochii]MEA1853965.1 sensor histidine kinase [Cytobacillus sp. OWB-43]MED1605336.1 sensor histidine kinase [Cytobacillus kochii]
MKKLLKVPIKIKILVLIVILIISIIVLLSAMYIVMKLNDDMAKAEELTMQTAKTVSYMPALHDFYNPYKLVNTLGNVVNQVKKIDNMEVFFQKRNGMIIASTDDESTFGELTIEEHEKALIYGSSYVMQTVEEDKKVIKAVAPIMVNYGEYKKVEGAVIVLFEVNQLYEAIWEDIREILKVSVIILFLGIFAGYSLTNSIRKDTLNLEPYEIAAMFRERNAILHSVKEGILSIDEKGMITMVNTSAAQLLTLESGVEGRLVEEVISSEVMIEGLKSCKKQVNVEIQIDEKAIIMNTQPIIEAGKRIGTVASLRDRTEIKRMIDAISEVKQYSDDLRAQSHEFTNKLYAILGLLQLDKKEKAIEFINSEATLLKKEEKIIFTKIKDERVQAILLGKLAQASEKKIDFVIDKESSLEGLPDNLNLSSLIIILGNLISNAFDAVKENAPKEVKFFVTDIGDEVIFEIQDNGTGIAEEMTQQLFEKGQSSKGKNRGYGLFNVQVEIESLNGVIEYSSDEHKGTIFTVYLPKKEGSKNGNH